jgi:hypothetical protein
VQAVGAVGGDEQHRVVEGAADPFVGAHHDRRRALPRQRPQPLELGPGNADRVVGEDLVERLRRRVIPEAGRRRLVEPHRIAGQPRFREDDALRALRQRRPDEGHGPLEAPGQVEEDGRVLNDREPAVAWLHPRHVTQERPRPVCVPRRRPRV